MPQGTPVDRINHWTDKFALLNPAALHQGEYTGAHRAINEHFRKHRDARGLAQTRNVGGIFCPNHLADFTLNASSSFKATNVLNPISEPI